MTEHRHNITAGLVSYNEAHRLEAFLEHWLQLSSDVVVLDQESTDNTPDVLAKFACPELNVYTTPHVGCAEPDFNLVQRMAGNGWSIHLGADEFIDPVQWSAISKQLDILAEQNVTAVWIRRKNFVDGKNIDDLMRNPMDPEGYDWQIRFAKGWTVQYQPNMHIYPHIVGRFAYLDPDKFWMMHRRTLDDLFKANIDRNRYATQEVIGMQERFMHDVCLTMGMTEDQYKEKRASYE